MLSRCRACDSRILTLTKQEIPLCRSCQTAVDRDVELRKTEIRKAIAGMRSSPVSAPALRAEAQCHLEVLLGYEKKGLAKIRPEPTSLLRRLDEFSGAALESATCPLPALDLGRAAFADSRAPRVDREPPRTVPQGPPPSFETAEAVALGPYTPDRRRAERVPVDFRVLISPLGYQAVARDVSCTGLYLQTGSMRSYRKPFRVVLRSASGTVETVGVMRRTDVRVDPSDGSLREGIGVELLGALPRRTVLDFESAVVTLLHAAAGPG